MGRSHDHWCSNCREWVSAFELVHGRCPTCGNPEVVYDENHEEGSAPMADWPTITVAEGQVFGEPWFDVGCAVHPPDGLSSGTYYLIPTDKVREVELDCWVLQCKWRDRTALIVEDTDGPA